MGQQLLELYARAEALGGFPAKVRLAGLTGITSTQAGAVPDTPDLLARCAAALETLGHEMRGRGDGAGAAGPQAPFGPPAGAGSGRSSETRLRRFTQVIADVMGQRSVFFARPAETLARLTEAAADGLGVARASVWFYDPARTLIRCADLFERDTGRHTSGVELKASAFPAYFAALESERTIAAHDAHTDPRTAEFSAPYLRPLRICSMLDVPIWVEGRMVGVLCQEHTGDVPRQWTVDDENFAYALAGFVALAEERRAAGRAQSPSARATR